MLEYVACFLVAMVLGIMEGAFAMRWYLCRPRKLVAVSNQSGSDRYQAFKASRRG